MNNKKAGLLKRGKNAAFEWGSEDALEVTDNSALLYKLSEACLGRRHIFREGIIEETPRLMQFTRIAEYSFLVNFTIKQYQPVSDVVGHREMIDGIQLIVLCTYAKGPKGMPGKIRFSVLHSISIRDVVESYFVPQDRARVHLQYTYALYVQGPRISVYVQGYVLLRRPMLYYEKWVPRSQLYFVSHMFQCVVDEVSGTAKRLS